MNVTLLINIFSFIYLPIRFFRNFLASNFLLILSPPQTCPASHAVVIQGAAYPWIAFEKWSVVLSVDITNTVLQDLQLNNLPECEPEYWDPNLCYIWNFEAAPYVDVLDLRVVQFPVV